MGIGAGPFATTTGLEWLPLSRVFNSIEQAKIPSARANAPSFLDMVPPRDTTTETLYPIQGRCQVRNTPRPCKETGNGLRVSGFALYSCGEPLARFRQEGGYRPSLHRNNSTPVPPDWYFRTKVGPKLERPPLGSMGVSDGFRTRSPQLW